MSSNPVKCYFYSMPNESKANLRYGTFVFSVDITYKNNVN